MKKDLLEFIASFTEVQTNWNSFIRDLSLEKELKPAMDFLGDNFTTKLMTLYRILNKDAKSQLHFFYNACGYNLMSIDKVQSNSIIIYSYIYLVHESKPIELKRIISNIISENSLKGLKYGNSILEDLLVKSFIFLEDRNTPLLKEWIAGRKLNNYYIYLRSLYFGYHNMPELALLDICKLFKGEQLLNDAENFILYNSLIDIFPKYISFTTLIKFLHENNINIMLKASTKDSINLALQVWNNREGNSSKFIEMMILHLEDYINKNQTNANLYPHMLDEISKYNFELRVLLDKYYYYENYNFRKSNNNESFIHNIISAKEWIF